MKHQISILCAAVVYYIFVGLPLWSSVTFASEDAVVYPVKCTKDDGRKVFFTSIDGARASDKKCFFVEELAAGGTKSGLRSLKDCSLFVNHYTAKRGCETVEK